jgi:enoyl-CoA hydratase
LFERVNDLDMPLVAAVNGAAVGAGCTLALLCDMIVMANDTYLSDPHVNVGLVPGDGGVVLWPALAGLPAARALLLTGDRLTAADAHRLGIVHSIVEHDAVVETAHALALRLAAQPRAAVRATRRLLRGDTNLLLAALDRTLAAENETFDALADTREAERQ